MKINHELEFLAANTNIQPNSLAIMNDHVFYCASNNLVIYSIINQRVIECWKVGSDDCIISFLKIKDKNLLIGTTSGIV